jgi:regulator of protease activity HflC (stomatin/prohibitin superfamily)
MGPLVGWVILIIAVVIIASVAKRIQEGSISPFEIARWRRRVPWIVIGLVVLILLASSIVVVPVGNRLVAYNYLTKGFSKPLQEGFGFVLPMIYEKYLYDVRTQVYTMSGVIQEGDVARADAIEVLSSDGLKMDLDITVQFRLQEDNVNRMHQEIGPTYVDKIIRPTVREAIRNEFAQHEATAAYSTKREEIEMMLSDRLVKALGKYYIDLQEVQIRNIELPPTVVAAIEEKKAAQQEAERMQYVLEKERQEKERIQIEAEAQAGRIETINEALASNPNYLQWLAIDKLNDNIELVISDGRTILNLDAYRGGN